MRGNRKVDTRKLRPKTGLEETKHSNLPGGPSSGLVELSRDAEEKIKAAEEAIDKVLSGDSERFLKSFVQEGGE